MGLAGVCSERTHLHVGRRQIASHSLIAVIGLETDRRLILLRPVAGMDSCKEADTEKKQHG